VAASLADEDWSGVRGDLWYGVVPDVQMIDVRSVSH